MKLVQVNGKLVQNAEKLSQALKSAGFQLENIVTRKGEEPAVFVYLQDAEEKNPTELVTEFQEPDALTAIRPV